MRIQRAYVGNKVVLQEHPTPSDLGTWYPSCLGALPQFFGVHAEESSGFSKIERVHEVVCRRTVGVPILAAQEGFVTADSASNQDKMFRRLR